MNGKNFTGVNAGLDDGSSKEFSMDFGTAGTLLFTARNRQSNRYHYTGLKFGTPGLYYGGLANGGTSNTPTQFDFGNTIGGSASAFAPGYAGNNPIFYYKRYGYNYVARNFDGYLGFLSSGFDRDGINGVYGWIKATWDGTNFQLYSAAYESTPGLPILAGAVPAPSGVPEIDPSGLASTLSLVMGSVAMLEQRRRKRAAVAA